MIEEQEARQACDLLKAIIAGLAEEAATLAALAFPASGRAESLTQLTALGEDIALLGRAAAVVQARISAAEEIRS